MNNPFNPMTIMQNPIGFCQQIMADNRFCNDPRLRKTAQMIQSHDTQGLQSMAENMCRSYGTTPEQVGDSIRQLFRM